MMQIFALGLRAMKAVANVLFENHPVDEQLWARRAHGEQIKQMGW